jgi:hypothetical protein
MLKNCFTQAAQKETAGDFFFRLLKNSICEASRSKERGVLFCTPQGRATMITKQMEIFSAAWQPD